MDSIIYHGIFRPLRLTKIKIDNEMRSSLKCFKIVQLKIN